MNVLVDRHHAGLYHALQLLFEDRLGATMFTPVGHEWWDDGYWRFGEVFGDDRLAQQYIMPEGHGWRGCDDCPFGGLYVTEDSEFPERKIFGLSVEAARRVGIDYVVATVQENQPGFARFANEIGAQFVVQVGNRGQRVDWTLDPLALVTAEAPIEGRGVLMHQEYDKDGVFAFRPYEHKSDYIRVGSFVNCFSLMPEQWSYFNDARRAGEDIEWFVHGHDGADGFVPRVTETAKKMASYQFAWHDKPQGDGFGHVIHYWASIGRPLVGHASYYRGLLAEHLWDEGVTSISLDGISPEQAVQKMRDIDADGARYDEMCHAIRERVDTLVDFAAEEMAVRALLGI